MHIEHQFNMQLSKFLWLLLSSVFVHTLCTCQPVWADLSCADLFEHSSHTYQNLSAKDNLEVILKSPRQFSRADLYQALYETYDVNSYIEAQNLNQNKDFQELVQTLLPFGESFKALFFDPGIVNHAIQFVEFIQSSHEHWENPWQLRQAFSRHLGKKTIYRAIAINHEVADSIHRQGLIPVGTAHKNRDQISELLFTPMKKQYDKHIYNGAQNTLFQSVSLDPELAVSVANMFGLMPQRKRGITDSSIYLFKIEVSNLDIIHFPGVQTSPDKESFLYFGTFSEDTTTATKQPDPAPWRMF